MGINSLAGHFFEITDLFFLIKRHARSVVPFARICAFVLPVSPMLGLRAWSDDLVAVLFELLDDDTKLAVLHGLAPRAALAHRRPGPCNARDALGAHGSRLVL